MYIIFIYTHAWAHTKSYSSLCNVVFKAIARTKLTASAILFAQRLRRKNYQREGGGRRGCININGRRYT
jgi:hypothetical protein